MLCVYWLCICSCSYVALGVSVSELVKLILLNSLMQSLIVHQCDWICHHLWFVFRNRYSMFTGIAKTLLVFQFTDWLFIIQYYSLSSFHLCIWGKKLQESRHHFAEECFDLLSCTIPCDCIIS